MSEVILTPDQKDSLVDRLEWKETRFCHEYLLDQNEFEAAKRAGYKEEEAVAIGRKLLNNTQILMLITTLAGEQGISLKMHQEDDVVEPKEVDTDFIITRLARLADYNSQTIKTQMITKSGNVIVTDKMRDGPTAIKALELLGKTKGMFKEKIEHSVDKDMATLIREARARVGIVQPALQGGMIIDGEVDDE